MNSIKHLIRERIPASLLAWYRMKRQGRFAYLKYKTGGLLEPVIYERLYEELQTAQDFDIIEVGGASGTASISIAWAMQTAKMKSRLVVIEKCEGGTRDLYGDYRSNFERFNRFIREFGVADRITLYAQYLTLENGAEVLNLLKSNWIAALVIDADGHIHRDFFIFWKRLVEQGIIVIDDYHKNLTPKHALTFRLLNQMVDWGLFEPVELI